MAETIGQTGEGWGADVPISMPVPHDSTIMATLDSVWVFTPKGMRINLTDTDIEEYQTPTYTPEGWRY